MIKKTRDAEYTRSNQRGREEGVKEKPRNAFHVSYPPEKCTSSFLNMMCTVDS